MYEVELKVRADLDRVRDRLDALDAEHVGTVVQEDVYYDAPDRDFSETDEALRLREETGDQGGTTRLTYKGPLVDADSKTREEAELTVPDPTAMRRILAGLGYEPAATVRKDRERYRLDGCTVTLDAVDGLGAFVEAERETDDDVDGTREQLVAVLDRLDLDADEQIRTSYLGLLLGEEESS